MTRHRNCPGSTRPAGILSRLARDCAGNTYALIAASTAPLLALVGGGIDMGRSYLSESRLQQACDAGVLAARKKLGSAALVDGTVPDDVATVGTRFFNLNFRDGAYGSADRTFVMSLQDDYSISALATVNVPTTIMQIFGNANVPITVECEAQLNFSNTDIMLVLDTTGSMALTNPGDSRSRIEILKETVQNFHAQLEASKTPGTRIRYGFVPYSTNVNVGALLNDNWVVDQWHYQSRDQITVGNQTSTKTYNRNTQHVSGSKTENVQIDSYPATWHATNGHSGGTTVDENENVVTTPSQSPGGYYTCDTPAPPDSYSQTDIIESTVTEPFVGPPDGTRTIEYRRRTRNGLKHGISRNGATCHVMRTTYVNYVETYERVTDPIEKQIKKYRYKQFSRDVTNWRTDGNGCIEERATYEISNYDNVDLSRALDLDLDLVPTSSNDTKWAPAYPAIIYARAMKVDGTGAFAKNPQVTSDEFVHPASIGLGSCPAAARKLSEMSTSQVSTYLASLYPTGQTYHDIGMIWGGRLISPTGLFASENADIEGKPTSRHLIFLTDGETAPLDLAYSSYGLEPLDERRWSIDSSYSLTQTVENRFSFACNEVKKRNVTVWVIGFGTTMNDMLKNCAGDGHWFQADDAAQLQEAFNAIAKSMGDLRISR